MRRHIIVLSLIAMWAYLAAVAMGPDLEWHEIPFLVFTFFFLLATQLLFIDLWADLSKRMKDVHDRIGGRP